MVEVEGTQPTSSSAREGMTCHETLQVEISEPKARLDKFLKIKFPDTSRGTFQRLIESEDVLVNNRPTKATYHPQAGDEISIQWPEPVAAEAQPENIPLNILFEDEQLIVLNKPVGMVVHPAAGHATGTLVNALLHYCAGKLSGIGGVARPGIVHRLDKDTSGCLVVAKDDSAHHALSSQFADHKTRKIYQAIVCDRPPQAHGTIRHSIARHPVHRKKMAVAAHGRDAITNYRLLKKLNRSALVEVELYTGRTHQIRVHFQHAKCPLVGDKVYGGHTPRTFEKATGYKAPRQMLHAISLGFTHPASGKELTFESPLPADFMDALSFLKTR